MSLQTIAYAKWLGVTRNRAFSLLPPTMLCLLRIWKTKLQSKKHELGQGSPTPLKISTAAPWEGPQTLKLSFFKKKKEVSGPSRKLWGKMHRKLLSNFYEMRVNVVWLPCMFFQVLWNAPCCRYTALVGVHAQNQHCLISTIRTSRMQLTSHGKQKVIRAGCLSDLVLCHAPHGSHFVLYHAPCPIAASL